MFHLHGRDSCDCRRQVLEPARVGQSDVSAAATEPGRVSCGGESDKVVTERDTRRGRTMPEAVGAGEGKVGERELIHPKMILILSTLPLAAQCPSAGRVVHVVFVRQLQRHLQSVAQVSAGAASGESRLFSGASLAARLVPEGL